MDKKFWFQILGLMIVIIGGAFFAFRGGTFPGIGTINTGGQIENGGSSVATNQLLILDVTSTPETKLIKAQLAIEVVDSKEERAKGLGGRESIASESGMLFTFEKVDKYKFWMKGMKIPLDFIWINNDRVVDLLADVKPPSQNQSDETLPLFAPTVVIDKVLEVNAGYIKSHNIRVGDKIEFTRDNQETNSI